MLIADARYKVICQIQNNSFEYYINSIVNAKRNKQGMA